MLARVGDVFKPLKEKQILVGGHTDDAPIHTARFPSNWELSTARAVNVVHFLADTVGVDPRQADGGGLLAVPPARQRSRATTAASRSCSFRRWPRRWTAAAAGTSAKRREMKSGAAPRCSWVTDDPLYLDYHDHEWGVPEWDDRALWEKLILDGFQAGLSWITILRKRENFRRALAQFDPEKIARFGARDVTRLLGDAGIVRNRAKLEATIGNARAFLELQEENGFASFCWGFVDGKPRLNRFASSAEVPAKTDQSCALSQALAQRGFRFVGPTIVYAWMQACGLVNDHLTSCFRYGPVSRASTASSR